MVRKCSAPNCKAGYAKEDDTDGITIHRIPKDPKLQDAWICAVPHRDLKPTEYSGICSQHFRPSDFITESQDTNVRRQKKRTTQRLARRQLKKDAIPSVFPSLPAYLSRPPPPLPRNVSKVLSSSRRALAADQVETLSSAFLERDKIKSLKELTEKLDQGCIPCGFLKVSKGEEDDLMFIYVQQENDGPANVGATLLIKFNLSFKMWAHDIEVTSAEVSHITSNKLTTCGEVLNILAFLKNLADEGVPNKTIITSCIAILEDLLPNLEDEPQQKLGFLLEQLDLLLGDSRRQRYSGHLATASTWLHTSSALYNQLQETLMLPTTRHLRQITTILNVQTGLTTSTIQYLKARLKTLSPRERLVSIIIDEVYSAKRIEFSGGNVYGIKNNEVTRTLLCFFISSVAGSYHDMVAMIPVTKLDADLINSNFQLVLKALDMIGFEIVAVSVDGFSANRKFYQMLCGNNMKPAIPHPLYNDERPVHLLFDSTHLFKNFYSNFINKGSFQCPNFQGIKLAPQLIHIRELYKKEIGLTVKVAHKLNEKVLAPHAIEKTNVMLADRLFHESTIAGLEFYAAEHPEWVLTANFLKLIRKWWNIVSIRTTTVGLKKRDETKRPITEHMQHHMLVEFADWLKEWQTLAFKKTSLSSETFSCAQQTCIALSSLAKYLLDEKNLNYVLLGKITSDPIEGRFGQYRQLSGASFYVSVRQILESEKLIRLKSLIKFNKLSLLDIKEVFSEAQEEAAKQAEDDSEALLMRLEEGDFNWALPSTEDDAIIYYVSGYIARSIMKKTSCLPCAELLGDKTGSTIEVKFADDIQEQEEIISAKRSLIEQVNRGGLVSPSDLLHTFCLLAQHLNDEIFKDTEIAHLFLSTNSRIVFIKSLMKLIRSSLHTDHILSVKCSQSHTIVPLLEQAGARFFNVMMKNYVSKWNDKHHQARKRGQGKMVDTDVARKVCKLQSEYE